MSLDTCPWMGRAGYGGEARYALDIRAYHDQVVAPAIASFHRLLDETRAKDSAEPQGGWVFLVSDQEDLLKSTIEAFCLALHSHFERRLRKYLTDDTPGIPSKNLASANWEVLQKAFEGKRGMALTAFDSFAWLDLLNTVGNVCRHGDGNASGNLHEQHPSLWPAYPDLSGVFDDLPVALKPKGPPGVDAATVPEAWLRRFTDAIAWFWDDIEYLNIRNIQSKAPAAVRRMDELKSTWPRRIKTIIYQ